MRFRHTPARTGIAFAAVLTFFFFLAAVSCTQKDDPDPPEPEKDRPFLKISAPGFYSQTDSDSPVCDVPYDELSDQISFSRGESERKFAILNPRRGTCARVVLQSREVTVGQKVKVSVSTGEGGQVKEATVSVLAKDNFKAWLENGDTSEGYIIVLRQDL